MRRRKLHLLLPLLALLASTISLMCHSALLTNIYNNKLSEITDLADRYLLVPNPQPPVEAAAGPTQSSRVESPPAESQMQADGPVAAPLVAAAAGTGNLWKNNPTASAKPNKASLSRPTAEQQAEEEFPNPNINNLGHEITKIIQKFFQHGYDKRVRPNYSGPPALINISIHIIGISSVNEVQMDFTTDFYFRQKWFDPRLEFEPVENLDELCLGAEFAEKIWLPDTFFANEKTATFHKATTENTFIRIGKSGRVYRSIRLTVTCSCPMELQYFPMDRQRCKIEIESYGYNTRDIDYRWGQGGQPVTLNEKIELPQFKVLGFKMGQEVQNLSSGDYIRLYCEIHFVRSMGYYLIQIYIPASLIVMISWVSFWLHRNATPARVALGVTTVLTMTTLMSSTNAALPKISYIKAIDVFLGTCFVMVFASLLEYASVGYIGKRIAMKRKRLQDLKQMQQHHQKVCVAAAASVAAAAAAAAGQQQHQHQQQTAVQQLKQNPSSDGRLLVTQLPFAHNQQAASQTLNRQDTASLMAAMGPLTNGSQTMRRTTRAATTANEAHDATLGCYDLNDPNYGQRSSIKVMLNQSRNQQAGHFHADSLNPKRGASIKRRLEATVGPAEHQNQHQHKTGQPANVLPPATGNQPISEAEIHATQDTVKVCGLTPSAIDKHSRVIFPICFVCFNLMYWIIYGHISQQTEDKGPPLIPVVKS